MQADRSIASHLGLELLEVLGLKPVRDATHRRSCRTEKCSERDLSLRRVSHDMSGTHECLAHDCLLPTKRTAMREDAHAVECPRVAQVDESGNTQSLRQRDCKWRELKWWASCSKYREGPARMLRFDGARRRPFPFPRAR